MDDLDGRGRGSVIAVVGIKKRHFFLIFLIFLVFLCLHVGCGVYILCSLQRFRLCRIPILVFPHREVSHEISICFVAGGL